MPSGRHVRWHTLIAAALTIGLLWWFLRSLNFAEVWTAIRGARVAPIVLAVVATFQTYVFRAWRWQALLRPIGRARFSTALRTTVIGFTATFLLPGRIGEVLRPYLLARREGFNAASTFATIIVERILDLATVLLLFGVFLLTTSLDVGPQVKAGGGIATAVAVAALVAMAVSAGHPERLGRWTERAARLLPGRGAAVAARFVHTFVEGLAVMRRPAALTVAMVVSVLLWISIALGVWLTSLALGVSVGFAGSFLVLMYLVVGVALPTPAGVGSFHAMYKWAVVDFFAADPDRAAAAAIVLHLVSFAPISLVGLALMAQDGLSLMGLKRLRSTAEAAEALPEGRDEVG
jgi:uncharacterized protein (TIRG00374 family)